MRIADMGKSKYLGYSILDNPGLSSRIWPVKVIVRTTTGNYSTCVATKDEALKWVDRRKKEGSGDAETN